MTNRLQFDDLTFDADSRQLWRSATEVRLSPKAFDLFALLIERRPDAISKAEIRDRLWPGTFVSNSSLPSLISEIRAAIGDHERRPQLVRTVHGFGYAFRFGDSPAEKAAQLEGAAPRGWLMGGVAEVALFAGSNVLGREGSGIILLQSSTISRRHARLTIDGRNAIVEDLGSKNGTYVNDRRVTKPTPVVEGDHVRIGSLLFTFRLSQPAGSTETVHSSGSQLRS